MNNNWRQTLLHHKIDICIGLITFGVALTIFIGSPVNDFSDSKYTLVVSESLLKHHSFALDHFAIPHLERIESDNHIANGKDYQLEWVGESLYYYHPPGSSVLSVPYVALMDAFGVSAINANGAYSFEQEIKLQIWLAAVLMAVLASVFYFTSRLALPRMWSVLVTLGAAFGTQVWSTMSRGLWSDTWGVLLVGLVVWILLASATENANIRAVLLATLLAWSYFVRPTNAIPILGITVYVFIYYRRALIEFLATGLIWLGLFIVYSEYHFGKVLPNYYRANRLAFTHFGEALAGNLVSPARGLLIYVPVLFFIFFLLVRYRRKIVFPRLVILALSIVTVHWIATSGFPHWWGGFSYGPRLMGGTVPWLILLAILGIQAMLKARAEEPAKSKHVRFWKTQNALGGLLLLASVFMNAMGPTMAATQAWNGRVPTVDEKPSRLWDWRYPQFLAGFLSPPLPEVFPPGNVRIDFSRRMSEPYLWYGWSINEARFRWTDGYEATVIFGLDEISDAELRMKFAPFLIAGKLNQQRVSLSLNGRPLDTLTLTNPEPFEYARKLPREFLQQKNILTFKIPDARTPRSLKVNADTRKVALALFWLEIETAHTSTARDERTSAQGPLPTGGFAAAIEPLEPPIALTAGELADVSVRVKNTSGVIWPTGGQSDGTYKVQLGDHWRDSNGRMLIMDDARTELPYDISPGREIQLTVTVRAPQTPGDYILEIDMVQERVKWFADEEESRPARIRIAVR